MSAIHVHNWSTNSAVPPLPANVAQTSTEKHKEAKKKETPTQHYLKEISLTPAATLLSPAAFAQKASSSKSKSNSSKPTITQQGPDIVEIPTPSSSSDSPASTKHKHKAPKKHRKSKLKNGILPRGYTVDDSLPSSSDSDDTLQKILSKKHKPKTSSKTPKLKDGYVPKGYALGPDGTLVNTNADATGTRYHAMEFSMSMTVEKLEGGGTREVWVRCVVPIYMLLLLGRLRKIATMV